MTIREIIRIGLMRKFGLPPGRPTDNELNRILEEIASLDDIGLVPDETDWRAITYQHVKTTEKHVYGGLDYSDLNALYAQLVKQTKK